MERFDIDENEGFENLPTENMIHLTYHNQGGFYYFVVDTDRDISLPRNRLLSGGPRRPFEKLSAQNPLNPAVENHRRLFIVGVGMSAQITPNQGSLIVGGNVGIISIGTLNTYIQQLIVQIGPIDSIRLIGNYSSPVHDRFVQNLANSTGMRVYASRGRFEFRNIASPPVNNTLPQNLWFIAHRGTLDVNRFFFCDPNNP
ncbi:hypothetical protein Xmau_02009 [Xenorhabdus mauleonii]|uniref:Uncharacterized protein n=1 Tax=Xenorhabdus mauleonii TaxID=351675 RepID=A0A1I3HVY6_9GAMM|nr:hypothetical protein [Xenorhabdus mauleonii]PHM40253.1 hypothetical protein Xmau_02009 [Xenorhabdus mauleonii]SFI39841.1 hypothetical protein SAMN05421680_10188 [Xenorhabdus mauleonii]